MPPHTALYIKDALRLLQDGEPHTLKLLKLSTGDVLHYEEARFQTANVMQGMITIRLPKSNLFRSFREVALLEIDDLKVYL